MTRRRGVIAGGIVAGLAVLFVINRAGHSYLINAARHPVAQAPLGDQLMRHCMPTAVAALTIDPDLHQLLQDRVTQAYASGGLSTAQRVFSQIAHSQLEAYADDDHVTGCMIAERNLYRAVLDHPHECQIVISDSNPALPPGPIADLAAKRQAVCGAEMVNGAQNRARSREAPIMSIDDIADNYGLYAEIWKRYHLPAPPLAGAEACASALQWLDTTLALGDNAAAYHRTELYDEGKYDYIGALTQPSKPADPPADFICPPIGTKFVLSMRDETGQPIVWESRGAQGFDCKVSSSAGGEHGLWSFLWPDSPGLPQSNPIRALWPLVPGKTAQYHYHPITGDSEDTTYQAVGTQSLTAAGRTLDVWVITEDVSLNDGQTHYILTDDWSPDLHWRVGQSLTLLHGKRPRSIAPDWHLVDVVAPPP